MKPLKHVKVAITGAAGHIGYALVFRIASGAMFGSDTHVDLNLIELPRSLNALEGLRMELEDCAFPLLKTIRCTADLNEGMSGVHWAILVGAQPRTAGMERADLLQSNASIFSEQGKALNQHAADDVRVFVVGNPCNTNSLIAMHHAPDIPRQHFFAMTTLDEKRACAQLAMKAGVGVHAVTDMTIWGNHSATQYPDFYHAKIEGKPVLDVIPHEAWLQTDFINTVQNRGAAVIQARGASSAASAANAIISGIYSLTHDTPADTSFSMALCSQGDYGVDPGLIYSFPCRVDAGTLHVVQGRVHNSFGQQKLEATLAELRAEKAAVQSLIHSGAPR